MNSTELGNTSIFNNSVKLLEYKPEWSPLKKSNFRTIKNKVEKQKSNNQFLLIAKLFEGINKSGSSRESITLDLDSTLQCLNLCMSFPQNNF